MFEQIGEHDSSRADVMAALYCWFATAIVSAFLVAVWANRATSAWLALLAASSTVLVAFGISAVAGRLPARSWKTPLVFATAAVWFTPLVLSARAGYVWSIAAASLFAMSLARHMSLYREPDDEDDPWRPRRSSHAAAVFLLLGGVGTVLGNAIWASLAAAVASFLIAWAARPSPRPINIFALGAVFRVLIAIAACALLWLPQRGPAGMAANVTDAVHPPDDDTHSGVILLAEPRPRTPLQAPRPRTSRRTAQQAPRQTDVIPFSGEYWFYHHPLARPPKNSLVQTGSPLTYVFTNVDHRSLSMVATQPLPQEFDSGCCSAVEVTIRNADTEPEQIGLELILYQTPPPEPRVRRPRMSLGSQSLASRAAKAPAEETLRFPIPPAAAIPAFDEIRVVFHLSGRRRYRSASVAIEGFALIPR